MTFINKLSQLPGLRAALAALALFFGILVISSGAFTPAGATAASHAPGQTSSPTPGVTPSPTPGGAFEIEAPLTGAALNGVTPTGRAKFEVEGGDREFEVEVRDVNLPAGTALNIFVDGTRVGALTLDSQRRGRFRVKTDDGQAVPTINSGTRVVVANGAGATIVAGSFSSATPTPTPGATPSPTPGATPSPTPGATPSPTPGATPSPTPGATPSPTPGATPSPTPGATPSPTPGATPSPTPGATPSPTPGATPSPTPGATPGPTPGASPSPTPGASPSPTPGATPTPSPTPGTNEIRIRGTLVGATFNGLNPSAEVEFRQEANNSRRLEIEVENVNLPAGTVLNVLVDNVGVGTIRLEGGMKGELRLRTDDGQTVPLLNLRSRVVITDGTGATIVAGSFSNLPVPPGPGPTPSPSPTPTPGTEFRIEARIAGAAIGGLVPRGHAKFRVEPDGRRKLNVEVEKVNLPAGTVLIVFVDGVSVGQLSLAPTLERELELDTNNGQFVPQVGVNTTVVVTNQQGATLLSGSFNTTVAPLAGRDIDNSQFFVEQQYRDFLDREADDSGLNFWKNQIAKCGADAPCVSSARVNTSGAFFLSIEFQSTGYMLYRFNKASFGVMPRRNEFLVDMQAAARGVVVGQTGWELQLEANKRSLAEAWVSRPQFRALFDGKTNEQFVDALFQNAGVAPTQAEREALISGLNAGTETRATVLRKVAENRDLVAREKNPAFVLMQYFGYLHRNPDEGPDTDLTGFNFWLRKLNNHSGDFVKAEMVNAFINSGEYRNRFNW